MLTSSRAWLLLGVLALLSTMARSDGIGNLGVLGQDTFGGIGGSLAQPAAAPSCASPTAPDGTVDFSKCSNAWYVAVIF